MRKLIIDENYFATPKAIVLGNSGEVASRKINVIQPAVEGASCYIARFSVSGIVYETEIVDGVITVPAVVLYEMGEGYMQWVARDSAGQLIAKSDLISYSVLRSLSDETTPIPVVEDTESAVSQIKEAYETAVHGLEQLNGYGTIAEVIQARRSIISNEIFSSLTDRIDFDIAQLQNAIESGTIIGDLEISGGIINSNSGNSITGTGEYSGLIAMGGGNTASGRYSVAIGAGCRATGQYSLVMGGGSTASEFCSVAIGVSNTASANNSISIGGSNTANGAYSAAIGHNCKALVPYSMAFGATCTVGNENNTTSGMYSVAIGANCQAQSSYSMTFGATCSVNGDYSFSGGAVCHARGSMSVSLGRNSDSYGDCSVSIGDHLIAVGENQTAFGKYNIDETEFDSRNLFVVGNGTDNNNRSNAMAVDFAGNLTVSGDITATNTNKETISLLNIYNMLKNIEERLSALETT